MSRSVSAPTWARGVHAVLTAARASYAENPSHAPRGTFTNHCPVRCIDRAADGWCDPDVVRALANAAGLDDGGSVRIAIIEWNARATTEEVLAAFDRAIEAAA